MVTNGDGGPTGPNAGGLVPVAAGTSGNSLQQPSAMVASSPEIVRLLASGPNLSAAVAASSSSCGTSSIAGGAPTEKKTSGKTRGRPPLSASSKANSKPKKLSRAEARRVEAAAAEAAAAAASAVPAAFRQGQQQPSTVSAKESPESYVQLILPFERAVFNVGVDHSYNCPYNWKPDRLFSTPTRALFCNRLLRTISRSYSNKFRHEAATKINVDQEDPTPWEELPLPFDQGQAKRMMDECERFCSFANPEALDEDQMENWEDHICRDGWLAKQGKIFAEVMRLFHADRLARLASKGRKDEVIQRRLLADRTAQRFRQLMSRLQWDIKTAQWLHNTLTTVLPKPYLAAYLEVLQTLRSKMHPSIIDRMTATKVYEPLNLSVVGSEGVRHLLKRKWDPVLDSACDRPPRKSLPCNPVIICTGSYPGLFPGLPWPKRQLAVTDSLLKGAKPCRAKRIMALFRSMGETIWIPGPPLKALAVQRRLNRPSKDTGNTDPAVGGDNSPAVGLITTPISNASICQAESVSGQGDSFLEPKSYGMGGGAAHSTPTVSASDGGEKGSSGDLSEAVSTDMAASDYLKIMMLEIAMKIREVKKRQPDRPIVLVGWGIAAAINCQLAGMVDLAQHHQPGFGPDARTPTTAATAVLSPSPTVIGQGAVSSCVCFGFPTYTLEGARGEPDDPIYDLKTPTLFVAGQASTVSKVDDLEDLRERMTRCPTGLVVVGGADDRLRMRKERKRAFGVTQGQVDRCILDEVRRFLFRALTTVAQSKLPYSNFIGDLLSPADQQHIPASHGTPGRRSSGKKRSSSSAQQQHQQAPPDVWGGPPTGPGLKSTTVTLAKQPRSSKKASTRKRGEGGGSTNTSPSFYWPGDDGTPRGKKRKGQLQSDASEGHHGKVRKTLDMGKAAENAAGFQNLQLQQNPLGAPSAVGGAGADQILSYQQQQQQNLQQHQQQQQQNLQQHQQQLLMPTLPLPPSCIPTQLHPAVSFSGPVPSLAGNPTFLTSALTTPSPSIPGVAAGVVGQQQGKIAATPPILAPPHHLHPSAVVPPLPPGMGGPGGILGLTRPSLTMTSPQHQQQHLGGMISSGPSTPGVRFYSPTIQLQQQQQHQAGLASSHTSMNALLAGGSRFIAFSPGIPPVSVGDGLQQRSLPTVITPSLTRGVSPSIMTHHHQQGCLLPQGAHHHHQQHHQQQQQQHQMLQSIQQPLMRPPGTILLSSGGPGFGGAAGLHYAATVPTMTRQGLMVTSTSDMVGTSMTGYQDSAGKMIRASQAPGTAAKPSPTASMTGAPRHLGSAGDSSRGLFLVAFSQSQPMVTAAPASTALASQAPLGGSQAFAWSAHHGSGGQTVASKPSFLLAGSPNLTSSAAQGTLAQPPAATPPSAAGKVLMSRSMPAVPAAATAATGGLALSSTTSGTAITTNTTITTTTTTTSSNQDGLQANQAERRNVAEILANLSGAGGFALLHPPVSAFSGDAGLNPTGSTVASSSSTSSLTIEPVTVPGGLLHRQPNLQTQPSATTVVPAPIPSSAPMHGQDVVGSLGNRFSVTAVLAPPTPQSQSRGLSDRRTATITAISGGPTTSPADTVFVPKITKAGQKVGPAGGAASQRHSEAAGRKEPGQPSVEAMSSDLAEHLEPENPAQELQKQQQQQQQQYQARNRKQVLNPKSPQGPEKHLEKDVSVEEEEKDKSAMGRSSSARNVEFEQDILEEDFGNVGEPTTAPPVSAPEKKPRGRPRRRQSGSK